MCIKQTSNRAVISASQSALAQHKGQNHRPGQAHMLARSMFLRLEMALESSGRTRQTSARAVISTLQGTGAQHNGQNHRPGRAHMLARSMFPEAEDGAGVLAVADARGREEHRVQERHRRHVRGVLGQQLRRAAWGTHSLTFSLPRHASTVGISFKDMLC